MITQYIEIILLISGIFTALAIAIFFFPARFYKAVFNLEAVPAVYIFIARHWGAVISLIGFLMIYAAYNQEVRDAVIFAASVGKIVFSGLVMFSPLRKSRVFIRLATFDAVIVALFAFYFAGL
jgi:hypothetical protein